MNNLSINHLPGVEGLYTIHVNWVFISILGYVSNTFSGHTLRKEKKEVIELS